jgi:FMN reductase
MRHLVIVSGGTSQPSNTRTLADRIAAGSLERLREMEVTATVGAVEVAPLALDVARASVTGVPSAELQAAIEQISEADAVIDAAPVYKAGVSGLLKSSRKSPIAPGPAIATSSQATRPAPSTRPRTPTSTRR